MIPSDGPLDGATTARARAELIERFVVQDETAFGPSLAASGENALYIDDFEVY